MSLTNLFSIGEEIIFALCGLVSVSTAFRALKNESSAFGSFLFWLTLGLIFIFGKLIPTELTGALLLLLGCLTVTKQVKPGKFENVSQEFKDEQAKKLKNKIFIPALTLGIVAMVLAQVKFKIDGVVVSLPGAISIGVASLLALLVGLIIAKPKLSEVNEDSNRLLMQVGSASLLPQLLGALGVVFTAAGVGGVISNSISHIVPEGNIVFGVIIYVLAMVIFTMVMGNAFAAFTVITIGIGVPFVVAQGGDPVIVGALGMTAGFCGTLITPMAANFNIVPGAVLETKDKYTIIKTQLPFSLIMIVVHIVLMLVLAF